jgi:hypothetical protein
MAEENLTKLIFKIHEDETNKGLVEKVLNETQHGLEQKLLDRLYYLVQKAELKDTNIISFPKQNIRLAQTELMAAAGQDLGDWFAQPLVFASSGMVLDIRKVLGSDNEVDVYIQSNSNDTTQIEKSFLPFRDKSLQVRLTIDGKEILKADIYVDESGVAAEGTGQLNSFDIGHIQGQIDFEVLIDNEKD